MLNAWHCEGVCGEIKLQEKAYVQSKGKLRDVGRVKRENPMRAR